MSGNLPFTLTSFQAEIQSRMNAVVPGTTNEELIGLYRAGELLGVTNTIFQAQVQTRLNAFGPGSTIDDLFELAPLVGKISNSNAADLQTVLSQVASILAALPVSTGTLATSAELAPLATSAALAPLATSAELSTTESNIIAAIPSGGGVSVQRGLFDSSIAGNSSADVTISSVDITKSLVHASGGGKFEPDITPTPVQLLNSTTIRIFNNDNVAITIRVAWQVIEYV